jgi:Mrp family chromosome partitioning ATPase/capsular polysaccharide biosynthesis protein
VTHAPSTHQPTLADYLAVVRRHLWLVIAFPILAVLVGFAVAKSEARVYQANSQVLVNRSDLATNITGTDPTIFDPARYLATEASIARSRTLASQVVAAARIPGLTVDGFLANSSVTVSPDADVLDFTTSWSDPASAVHLANAYATAFTGYTAALSTQRLDSAIRTLAGPLASLHQGARPGSSQAIQTLEQYKAQLETIRTYLADSNTVLQNATLASQVSPRTRRDVIIAGLVGGILALALAFVVDALDRRVRSEAEIEEMLGAPLLARLPRPPRSGGALHVPMALSEPESSYAASVRKLRTALAFQNLDRRARTILIASAVSGEGTSTTLANLGVVCARSGSRVAVVDLDLERPSVHDLFGVSASPGIGDVVAGRASLRAALRQIGLPALQARSGESPDTGSLALIPGTSDNGCGSVVDLLASRRFDDLLGLLDEFDLVLIGAAPVLGAGEAIAITPKVEGMVLVLHEGITRPVLRELAREVAVSRAPLLGFALTQIGRPSQQGRTFKLLPRLGRTRTKGTRRLGRTATLDGRPAPPAF